MLFRNINTYAWSWTFIPKDKTIDDHQNQLEAPTENEFKVEIEVEVDVDVDVGVEGKVFRLK